MFSKETSLGNLGNGNLGNGDLGNGKSLSEKTSYVFMKSNIAQTAPAL